MKHKILFFVSPFLRRYMEEVTQKIKLNCSIEFAEYCNFAALPDLFWANVDRADAFMVYGQVAGCIVKQAAEKSGKRVRMFDADITAFYRLMIELFLKNHLDPQRVIFDYLLLLPLDPTVQAYIDNINEDNLIADDLLFEWEQQLSSQDYQGLEHILLTKIQEAWEAQNMDLVLCSFSTLVPDLERLSIAYRYVMPTADQIHAQLDDLCTQLEIDDLKSADAENSVAGSLVPSMGQNREQEFNQRVTAIAEACGFSTTTVQKLFNIVETQNSLEFTTQELADSMISTVRYAQRILRTLEDKGYASYVYPLNTSARGRPRKVYRLKLWDDLEV